MGKNTARAGSGALRPAACSSAAAALFLATTPAWAQPAPAGAQPPPPSPPTTQPAPLPASEAAPATTQPGAGSSNGYGLTAAPVGAATERQGLPRFAPIIRGGLLVGGSGTWKSSCDGNNCDSSSTDSLDYSHKVAFAVSADFLWRLGSIVRLGPGLMYVGGESVKLESGRVLYPNNKSDPSIGSDLAIDAVLEFAPQVADTVWLAPRLQLGMGVLFPGGDLNDYYDYQKSYCTNSGQLDGCDSVGNASVGWHAGVGFGVVFSVSNSVRLRGDVFAQYYAFKLYGVQVKPPVDAKYAENIASTRGFLFFGIEF